MASPELEAATALKLQGNKAFGQHDWPTAVEFYTQAIDKYDREPSFFSNRAQVRCDSGTSHLLSCFCFPFQWLNDSPYSRQCHIKLEAYGFAVADATKALELDPSYVKVR